MQTILFVNITGDPGGATSAMFRLIKDLDRAKYLPLVLLARDGRIRTDFEQLGCKTYVKKLGQIRNTAHSPLKFDIQTILMFGYFVFRLPVDVYQIIRIIKNEAVDIVHINVSTLYSTGIAAKLSKKKVIWHIREVLNDNWFTFFQIRVIDKCSDRILCISRGVAKLFFQTNKIEIIYDGIAASDVIIKKTPGEIRNLFNIVTGKKIFLMLGMITGAHGKGFYDYLEAISLFLEKDNDSEFCILGDSQLPGLLTKTKKSILGLIGLEYLSEREKLEKKAEQLKIKNVTHFIGYKKNVFDYINAADIIVIPHRLPEGFGLSLIESGMLSKPIISTNIEPTPEIITHYQTGILIPPGDVVRLCEAMLELKNNSQLCQFLGTNLRKDVSERFELSQLHKKIFKAYEQLEV